MAAGIRRVLVSSSSSGKVSRLITILFLTGAAAVLLAASSAFCSGFSEDDVEDKKVLIMPVAVDSEISTGEAAALSNYVNAEMDDEFSKKLDDAEIIGTLTAQARLASTRKTRLPKEIFDYYDKTEEFNIAQIESIRSVIGTDFVVLSLMKVEQYEVEFELFFIDLAKKETLWQSKSEFERGTIVGMGSSELKNVAKELVETGIFRGILRL